MQTVTIPFLTRWEADMLYGRKTATSRSKRYGDPGDRFKAFGAEFEIVSVELIPLEQIAKAYWNVEGAVSPGDFMAIWSKLHRGIWNPNRQVYFHRFRKIGVP